MMSIQGFIGLSQIEPSNKETLEEQKKVYFSPFLVLEPLSDLSVGLAESSAFGD